MLPLKRCGGAYCTEYSVDGQRFRAVVDTGSPFLLVDGSCDASTKGLGQWGCYKVPCKLKQPKGLCALV